MQNNYSKKSKILSIAIIVVLLICLALSYYVVAMSDALVSGSFSFGKVDVVIGYYDDASVKREYISDTNMFNKDKLVSVTTNTDGTITSTDLVSKKFYVENRGDIAAHYRVYFENMTGDMKSDILVTIRDADTGFVYIDKRSAECMDRAGVNELENHGIIGTLEANGIKDLIIELSLPEDESEYSINKTSYFQFDLCVEAVQAYNNSEGEFN